jgi:ribosomal protein S18 acetylase RimI-like enzyme
MISITERESRRVRDVIEIAVTHGTLRLRPEQEQEHDQAFRFELFCQSRAAEFALLPLDAGGYEKLMRFQFQAQTATYRANFPNARCDIIELDGTPIGRIVVDRPGDMIYIVDQAIVPPLRSRGFGTAIMTALMKEAGATGLPVRLKVASSNDAAMRLYLRLGFVPIHSDPLYVEMEWLAPAATDSGGR